MRGYRLTWPLYDRGSVCGRPSGLVGTFLDGEQSPCPPGPGVIHFVDVVVQVEVPRELRVSFEVQLDLFWSEGGRGAVTGGFEDASGV